MAEVAAASLALRDAPLDSIIILESHNGHRFPNGVVADSDIALPLRARRWWNPNCAVRKFDKRKVCDFLNHTDLPRLPLPPEAWVGWGPGLTPAGDDAIAGMLITFHALGMKNSALALYQACDRGATTAYSHALISYAHKGQAARPVLHLMETLAGFGDLDDAIQSLSNFGATSGYYLMEGVRQAINVSKRRTDRCDHSTR
ncbi:MAG: DUF2877 domain-containing protein [Actinomycetota bacterium]|nr:DUF2877 domain-containing protein [Actinomycetota bacterium]